MSGQEDFTQNIRGKVVDMGSGYGLPNANIIVLNSEPSIGASADVNGLFLLENVPVGRQSLQVSYTGYQTVVLSDLYVSTGKELVLRIELKELIETMVEVEIVAEYRKDKPINPMAIVSARSFSVEETNKYAGSYGDPARMAANFAGVASSRDNRNDIAIRGNSPIGLQYRLNGVEITNPNHFAAQGTTGGPITMLNTNLLANSDFFTGAFPASYGNALSGVFDLKLRNGNADRYEFWGQLGWNGLEFGLEGPFSKKSSATYLAAYRYSITDILEKMGVQLEESARYQDLSFNLNFPTIKAGVFSLFGMGGSSGIKNLDSDKEIEDWTFATHGEDLKSKSVLFSLGFSHHYYFNSTTSLQSRISAVGSRVETQIDTFSIANETPFIKNGENSSEMIYGFSTQLSKKFNAASTFDVGLSWDLYDVDYEDSLYMKQAYKQQTNIKTQFSLFSAFAQWKYEFSNTFSTYVGLHYQYFTLNGSQLPEPRLGLQWKVNARQSISFGAGLQSQTQARLMYFVQTPLPDDKYALTNKQMDFSKSLQFVLGYDYLITEFFRLKAETYYQHLYDIPVKQSIPQYSILNEGAEFFLERMDSLVNRGTGTNYGLELTLEKFMSRNYYFLLTASLFQSKYKGYDGMERSTSFNNNYVLNAVGAYELPFGKRKNRALILGLRMTLAGGKPYVPFDQEATVEEGQVVYDWEDAYVPRHQDYFRTSFRVGIRRNERKFNTTFLFDLQYRANYTYIFMYRIDVVTGKIIQDYQMGWYPNATVRFQF
ncbi:MAG: TonB-dependent receptor [Bacteroidetes bacterium]|nr:TonB-dependent receptor [Bacteroidota bacterium]